MNSEQAPIEMNDRTSKYKKTEMVTYTGELIDLNDPERAFREGTINVKDIAFHLAHHRRWCGARGHRSVAAHCIDAMKMAKRDGYSLDVQLLVLFHDAHEAYTGDVTRPVKSAIEKEDRNAKEALESLQRKWQDVITRSLNLPWSNETKDRIIDQYDLRVLDLEFNSFYKWPEFTTLVARRFMKYYRRLNSAFL